MEEFHRWLQAASRLLHVPVHRAYYHLSRKEVSSIVSAAHSTPAVTAGHQLSGVPIARLAMFAAGQHCQHCQLPPPPLQVCKLYTTTVQVLCGCLAPMLYHYCRTARHALDFAARRGISAGSPRLRWYRFVHTRLCATTWLPVRLLVVLPVTLGVVVLLSDVLPAEYLHG